MEKVLINVTAVSIGEAFDMFVPADMKLSELVKVMTSGIAELSGGRYGISEREMLMTKDPFVLLDPERTLMDYNIHDGKSLLMI